MSNTHISIDINLAALQGQLQRVLRHAMNLVAVGLRAEKELSKFPLDLPDTNMHLRFDTRQQWTSEQVGQEWRRWILTNGFRDTSEAVGGFLEGVQSVLGYWELIQVQDKGTTLTGAVWNDMTVGRTRRFHRLGLPDKIKFLETQYGFALDASWAKQILSINKTRNCLVHRNGIVTELDVTANGKLILEWAALVLVVKDNSGEREIVPPAVVEAGGTLSVRNRPYAKEFAVGEEILLTTAEFSGICWTLFTFGNFCAQLLEQFGKSRGITFKNASSVT